ncbi:PEP-CTERM sorting domain-containing protein [Gloeothece citriformis]|uniref:PEP-CTERM sorting domain-containing protein n=1 Tax=Gloeothece citriformis TaxID=2546356 RepID=UPI0002F173D4|nr:PEP-CTERM sorting domain-containing protein [Gloeothece citriformis]
MSEGTFSNFRFSEVNKETQEEIDVFEPSSDEIIEGELTSKLIFRRTDLIEEREFDNFFEFSSTSLTNVEMGQPFVLGYFTYKNGRFFLNSDSDQIRTLFLADLTGKINSPQPQYSQSFTTKIGLDITPNIGNSLQNADIIYFLDYPEYGSFRIYEDQEATVEILGIFSSFNLNLAGFGNILSGEETGFTTSSIERFVIPEPFTLLGTATAICFGAIFKRKLS